MSQWPPPQRTGRVRRRADVRYWQRLPVLRAIETVTIATPQPLSVARPRSTRVRAARRAEAAPNPEVGREASLHAVRAPLTAATDGAGCSGTMDTGPAPGAREPGTNGGGSSVA